MLLDNLAQLNSRGNPVTGDTIKVLAHLASVSFFFLVRFI